MLRPRICSRARLALTTLLLLPGCLSQRYDSAPSLRAGRPVARGTAPMPSYLPPQSAVPLAREVTAPGPSQPDPQARCAASAVSEFPDPYVAQLLDLLGQTKSVDAFRVSVQLLAEVKPTPWQAIPSIIRNAERLGIYGEHCLKKESATAEVADGLTELLLRLSKDRPGARGTVGGRSELAGDKDVEKKSTPDTRLEELLFQSEDLRQIEAEWRRFWFKDTRAPELHARPTAPTPPPSSPSGTRRGPAGKTGPAAKVLKLASGLFTPVPIHPCGAEQVEEKLGHATEHRTPILPPIAPGERPLCANAPDHAEILRALSSVKVNREGIDITVEKLVDTIDPPRFFPLIGPAQLHHCHWKCTVYYTEKVPMHSPRRRTEVVYIDRDHLHLCIAEGNEKRGVQDMQP